jgi:hypothetical protein
MKCLFLEIWGHRTFNGVLKNMEKKRNEKFEWLEMNVNPFF